MDDGGPVSQFGEGGGDPFHHAVIVIAVVVVIIIVIAGTVQVVVGKVDGRFGRVINAVAQRLFGVSPGGRSGSPAAVAIVEGHCHRGGGGRSAGRRYRRARSSSTRGAGRGIVRPTVAPLSLLSFRQRYLTPRHPPRRRRKGRLRGGDIVTGRFPRIVRIRIVRLRAIDAPIAAIH